MAEMQFTEKVQFEVAPALVYHAFTTMGGLLDWLCHGCNIQAGPVRRISWWTNDGWEVVGRFTELVENQVVAIEAFDPHPLSLRVALSPVEGGTALELTVKLDTEDAEAVGLARQRWQHSLANLNSIFRTGLDERLYSRPMMGIFIGGTVSADNQAQLGIPVDYGIVLGGVVSGLGAEAAGLQANDVLVEMNGVTLNNLDLLGSALAGKRAGDVVQAVWYRGAERQTAEMPLRGRPRPVLPESQAAFVDLLRGQYARLQAELAALLDGVTDAQGEARTAETEWNAKELLAHLIVSEQAAHIWLVGVVEGEVFVNWMSNDTALVRGAAAGRTLAELAAQLTAEQALTVSIAERLPEKAFAHRGIFINLFTTLVDDFGLPAHTRGHFASIQQALAA